MKQFLSIIFLFLLGWNLHAQNERSLIRKGLKDYREGNFSQAEVNFMEALEIDSTSLEAGYNLASSLYKQERYTEAGLYLSQLADKLNNPHLTADVLHNIGNSFLKQEMYPQSIEAYKNALKIRPDDDETRYNLAYAQAKLKKQQDEQEQEKKDQDEQQQNDQDQQKEEQQEQDKQEQEEQKNEDQKQDDQQDEQQENDQEQNEQQEDQEQKNEDKEGGQNNPQPAELSKEDMERMLKAISQEEKDVREKLEKQKAAAKKVKTEKDW